MKIAYITAGSRDAGYLKAKFRKTILESIVGDHREILETENNSYYFLSGHGECAYRLSGYHFDLIYIDSYLRHSEPTLLGLLDMFAHHGSSIQYFNFDKLIESLEQVGYLKQEGGYRDTSDLLDILAESRQKIRKAAEEDQKIASMSANFLNPFYGLDV